MNDIIPDGPIQSGFTIPVLDHGFVRYIDHMGTDTRIVEAARISYRAPSKGADADQRLLEYLWKNKHTSPFEMVKLTLNIKMPIFVMRQYVRHRMQNLNEVSARYTELPEEFYIPETWRVQAAGNKQCSVQDEAKPIQWHADLTQAVHAHSAESYRLYKEMIAGGVAREMARMVLPVNIYTEIYACWDLKNLMHFITLRDDAHAQAEIQEYGKAIKAITRKLFPGTIQAFEKYKWKLVDA